MADLDQWLVFLHILGAATWLGAWAAICVFAADAVRRPSIDGFDRLFAVMRRLGPMVIGPSTLLVLVPGLVLVGRYGRLSFSARWIVAGLVLYAVTTLLGMIGLSRAGKAATAAVSSGDLPAAVAATRRWLTLAVTALGLLVLATADMVFRP
jgi:uncharacterized membrane protein